MKVENLEVRCLLATSPLPSVSLQPEVLANFEVQVSPVDPESPIYPDLQRYAADPSASPANRSPVPGWTTGPVEESWLFDDQGRIGLQIIGGVDDLLPSLTEMGLELWASSAEFRRIEGAFPVEAIGELAGLSDLGLQSVTPILKPIRNVGSVTSQADVVHETDRVRNQLPTGFDGTGVTVGVISDSYADIPGGVASGVASGDLPNVTVLEDLVDIGLGGSGIDEGRAMTELIHDLAPGAEIAFATGFGGEQNFADNIRALANFGADIIVDDLLNRGEPFFQDGIIAQAVDDVVTNNGVTYFSSAGNFGDQGYESIFRPGADPFFAGTFHDFDPGPGVDTRQLITVQPGQTFDISLQWDDPFLTTNGVDTNVNLFALVPGTTTVIAGSAIDNPLFQFPLESLSVTNTGTTAGQLEVLIQVAAGPNPGALKYINFGSNATGPVTFEEFATGGPTIVGHAAADGAISVAAVNYFSQDVPAGFTSIGPTPIFFDADGTPKATTEVRATPTLSAVQATNTTFFGNDLEGDGFPNFSGTSAAAPHAAAVAALVIQSDPSLTPQQVEAALATTAEDLGTPGFDNLTGAGLINAFDAVLGPAQAASLDLQDGFESGVLGRQWETETSVAGRIRVTAEGGPRTGASHLVLDSFVSTGLPALNQATLVFDATTATDDVIVEFAQREFSDEDDPLPASFIGSANGDGVAFSVDGTNYFRLVSLVGSASLDSYQTFSFNLTQIATDLGLTLSSETRIRFQQFDNFPVPDDGLAFDDLVIREQAVVVPPTLTVTTATDELDPGFDPADLSLREAVSLANLSPDANTITFDASLDGTPLLISQALGPILLTENTTVTGLGAGRTILDGNGAINFPVLTIGSAGNTPAVTLQGLTIRGGGQSGIRNDGGQLRVLASVITGNSTAGQGGGLSNIQGQTGVIDSTVSGNTATQSGGGIAHAGGTLSLTNTTISGNTAGSSGGGLFNDATVSLVNTTIAENSATTGGGLFVQSGALPATLANSLIAGNTVTSSGIDVVGAVDPTSQFNLIGAADLLTGINDGSDGNQVGTSGSPINPLIGPLQNNGGSTFTHLPLAGSPALDAGAISAALDPTGAPLLSDQRGLPRLADGTPDGLAEVDLGAVEVGAPLTPADRTIVGTSAPETILVTQGVDERFGPGAEAIEVTVDGNLVLREILQRIGSLSLEGLGGADILDGSGATIDLLLLGGDGSDTITGGDGSDTIIGGGAEDSIVAGDGNDFVNGDQSADRIEGGLGDDTLIGRGGNDTLIGGAGNDSLVGLLDDDSIQGGDGNDILEGGNGLDVLQGENNDDLLVGGQGGDSLEGGSGIDTLDGGRGTNILNGGADADIFQFQGGVTPDRHDLDQDGSNQLRHRRLQADATVVATDTVTDFASLVDAVLLLSLSGNDTVTIDPALTDVTGTLNGGLGTDSLDLPAGLASNWTVQGFESP